MHWPWGAWESGGRNAEGRKKKVQVRRKGKSGSKKVRRKNEEKNRESREHEEKEPVMTKLLENLGSKKLLVTLAGLLGIGGLEDVDTTAKAWALAIVCAGYALAQGLADGMSKKYEVK